MERKVMAALQKYKGWDVQQNNDVNVRAVDLIVTVPGKEPFHLEIKHLQAPYSDKSFRTPAGLKPREHLTVDIANLEKYPDETWIMCVVNYTQHPRYPQPTKGVYVVSAKLMKDILARAPGREYNRSTRSTKDKVRKIGISIDDCRPLIFPGMTMAQTYDAINEM